MTENMTIDDLAQLILEVAGIDLRVDALETAMKTVKHKLQMEG